MVLAVALGLLMCGSAGLVMGAVIVQQTKLGHIADETARAAAIALVGGTDPCAAATAFLVTPGVELRGCSASDSVTIEVDAPAPALLHRLGFSDVLHATARAGP